MTSRLRVLLTALALISFALQPAAVRAQTAIPGECKAGQLQGGALSLICVPVAGWNGDLVVFAHGYVPAGAPLGFYNLTVGGVYLPDLVQSFGFAFATTSYRQNGLAILEGVDDIQKLIAEFKKSRTVVRAFITGASEGGLVATLLAERAPHLFARGLAACGPIGSFRGQINYVGDFRVLFDYFFPDVLPGSAVEIPPLLLANWFTVYLPAVQRALLANPARALELMRTANAAYDPADFSTVLQTASNVLWYGVFGGVDAIAKLGGNPFGNRARLYLGSSNDLRLNLRVERFSASPVAVAAMREYETSGALGIPLVTIHTTSDEVVPFWHELLYGGKVFLSGQSGLVPLPVARYGHCNLTPQEILGAFALTVR
jgi:pimeloyl-ACP methyl ester carboxylesterase